MVRWFVGSLVRKNVKFSGMLKAESGKEKQIQNQRPKTFQWRWLRQRFPRFCFHLLLLTFHCLLSTYQSRDLSNCNWCLTPDATKTVLLVPDTRCNSYKSKSKVKQSGVSTHYICFANTAVPPVSSGISVAFQSRLFGVRQRLANSCAVAYLCRTPIAFRMPRLRTTLLDMTIKLKVGS